MVTNIIAFCGINGCGKSTLIKSLSECQEYRDALVLNKDVRRNVECLNQFFPGFQNTVDHIIESDPGVLLRYGYAFDFLNFYQSKLVEINNRDGLVFAERWNTCIEAWNEMVGLENDLAMNRLVSLMPDADFTIYIRVDPVEAVNRLKSRGATRINDDIRVLQRQAIAYDRIQARSDRKIIEINSKDCKTDLDICRSLISAHLN